MKHKKLLASFLVLLAMSALLGITHVKVHASETEDEPFSVEFKYGDHITTLTERDYVEMSASASNIKISINGGDYITVKEASALGEEFGVAFTDEEGLVFVEGIMAKFRIKNNELRLQYGEVNEWSIKGTGKVVFIPKDFSFYKGPNEHTISIDDDVSEQFLETLVTTKLSQLDLSTYTTINIADFIANRKVLGRHPITFTLNNSAWSKPKHTLYINIVDLKAPTITGSTATAKVGYDETFNIENFRKTLTVEDNHSVLTNDDIYLESDNYTKNKNKLGTYEIKYAAKDVSGNKATFVKVINVVDKTKPEIIGPNMITSSTKTIMTLSEILRNYQFYDAVDGNLVKKVLIVKDDYTGNGDKVGSYSIHLRVEDVAGNVADHIITMNRVNNLKENILIFDNDGIVTSTANIVTHEDIIEILKATNQLNISSQTNVEFTLDEYTENAETIGIYNVKIETTATSGIETKHEFIITVKDPKDLTGIVKVGPSKATIPIVVIIGVVIVIGVIVFSNRKR